MVVTKATLTLPPARLVVLVVRKVARLPASHHRSPSSERERHTACSNRERGRSGQRSCRDLKIRPVRLLHRCNFAAIELLCTAVYINILHLVRPCNVISTVLEGVVGRDSWFASVFISVMDLGTESGLFSTLPALRAAAARMSAGSLPRRRVLPGLLSRLSISITGSSSSSSTMTGAAELGCAGSLGSRANPPMGIWWAGTEPV